MILFAAQNAIGEIQERKIKKLPVIAWGDHLGLKRVATVSDMLTVGSSCTRMPTDRNALSVATISQPCSSGEFISPFVRDRVAA
jgi:hypothetical protein